MTMLGDLLQRPDTSPSLQAEQAIQQYMQGPRTQEEAQALQEQLDTLRGPVRSPLFPDAFDSYFLWPFLSPDMLMKKKDMT